MTDHFVIPADELLADLAHVKPCQDCAGRLGLFIDLADPDGWEVIQLHDVPCVAMNNPPTPEGNPS